MKQSKFIAILISSLAISFAATSHATIWYTSVPGAACSLVNVSDHHYNSNEQRWYGGLVNDNYTGVTGIAVCPLSPQSPSGSSPAPINDITQVYISATNGTFQTNSACLLCTSYSSCIYGNNLNYNYYYWTGSWSESPMEIECTIPGRGIITNYGWNQTR